MTPSLDKVVLHVFRGQTKTSVHENKNVSPVHLSKYVSRY